MNHQLLRAELGLQFNKKKVHLLTLNWTWFEIQWNVLSQHSKQLRIPRLGLLYQINSAWAHFSKKKTQNNLGSYTCYTSYIRSIYLEHLSKKPQSLDICQCLAWIQSGIVLTSRAQYYYHTFSGWETVFYRWIACTIERIIVNYCLMCLKDEEPIKHLLLNCSMAREVQYNIFSLFNVYCFLQQDLGGALCHMEVWLQQGQGVTIVVILCGTCLDFMKERNIRCFNNKFSKEQVLSRRRSW